MVSGPSMLPTFNVAGDWLLIDMMMYQYTPAMGDVLVLESPLEPEKYIVKRVLATAGDDIFKDPTVNGERITVKIQY